MERGRFEAMGRWIAPLVRSRSERGALDAPIYSKLGAGICLTVGIATESEESTANTRMRGWRENTADACVVNSVVFQYPDRVR